MRPILAVAGLTGGVMLVVSGRLYQGIHHPEWSEMGALIQLWWVWLAAIVMFGVGAAALNR